MLMEIIAFLVMLNPFALFIYLGPVMEELSNKNFLKVLTEATLISLGIFLAFFLTGDFMFQTIFQISFDSFRIFGGIVIFSFAYLFIVKGQKALIHMKENLDDLASEIALPFMIGAGTLSLTILMSYSLSTQEGIFVLVLILVINFFSILLLKYIKDGISRKKIKIAFDKNMEVLLRLLAFFMGAIGINMIVTGLRNLFF